MLSRFHLIPERYGQTDRFAISISHVSMLTRDKNHVYVRLYCACSNYIYRSLFSPVTLCRAIVHCIV